MVHDFHSLNYATDHLKFTLTSIVYVNLKFAYLLLDCLNTDRKSSYKMIDLKPNIKK